MGFELLVVGSLVLLLLGLLALGAWHPRSGAQVLDWKPTRSYEDEIRLELEDVDQMLEAQNERRRRSGRREISEDDIRAEVQAEERELLERAERFASDETSRSAEDEARLEREEIEQMLAARNELRRRSGQAPVTEEEVRAQVEAEQRELGGRQRHEDSRED